MIITFPNAVEFINNLRAASRAARVDPAIESQHCVRVEFNGAENRARFIATNGHWMWVNEIYAREVQGVDEKGVELLGDSTAEVSIPLHHVTAILKEFGGGKLKARSGWRLELDTDGKVSWPTGRVDFKSSEAQLTLPWRRLLPHETSLTGTKRPMSFDAAYLSEISAAFVDILGRNVKNGIGLSFQMGKDNLDLVIVSSAKLPTALVLLMPRREEVFYGGSNCTRYGGHIPPKEKVA